MKIKSNPGLTVLTIVFGLLVFNYFFELVLLKYIILLLAGMGVMSKKFCLIVERVWFRLAFILSQIIPSILLSIIFYFLLMPLSFFSKIFKSKTNFKSINNSPSVFSAQKKFFDKKSFERTW